MVVEKAFHQGVKKIVPQGITFILQWILLSQEGTQHNLNPDMKVGLKNTDAPISHPGSIDSCHIIC